MRIAAGQCTAPGGASMMLINEEDKLARALELHELSRTLQYAGDFAGAESRCRQALAIFEEIDGPVHPDVANLLQSLGTILEQQGLYDDAGTCASRAIAIMDEVADLAEGPEAALILIQSLWLLGTARRQKGRYRDAEAPLRRAVELSEMHADGEVLAGALND